MIRINPIKLRPDHGPEALREAIAKRLRLKEGEPFTYTILRQSIDARKKPDIFYVYTVDVKAAGENRILKRTGKDKTVTRAEEKTYRFPHGRKGGALPGAAGQGRRLPGRPVIVGSGPAGLFCALMLAREGLCPLVIERGEPVEERARSVDSFWEGGALNPDSNVQFGEGGAGTFSDGKLNTSIKDPSGRVRFVLQTFADAGADPDILYSYKPHIGTDMLRGVIRNLREEILSLGGTFLFSHRLEQIEPARETGRYRLRVRDLKAGEILSFESAALVLALGHSARDTFEMLRERQMTMQPKAFAVGVRIQHPQRLVDDAMYGADCPYRMPPSPYKLTCQLETGGVYSFCMCPGGYVVNASSEPGMIAVNGMSLHGRGSGSANAAIVMTVGPEPGDDPLAGMAFSRRLERQAFLAGGGAIPAQRFGDFCREKKEAASRPAESGAGRWADFTPRIKGRYAPANLRGIFPERIAAGLEEAICRFDKVIPGFADPRALLCGPESRTSSPVRLVRDKESLQSVSHPGIYPCGEGAGYAGGITSAAIDGIRVAEKIREYSFDFADH